MKEDSALTAVALFALAAMVLGVALAEAESLYRSWRRKRNASRNNAA
ncbi:hypothetical protein ABFU65_10005 [Xanthomonas campestris pv. raphani]|nr:hypothetical protein [Xanthomonas campestris]MEA9655858.1 hypothetical protein [Xanthomonas campestris pv. raphani]